MNYVVMCTEWTGTGKHGIRWLWDLGLAWERLGMEGIHLGYTK
jgi:hypothetical protein